MLIRRNAQTINKSFDVIVEWQETIIQLIVHQMETRDLFQRWFMRLTITTQKTQPRKAALMLTPNFLFSLV
ncbi:hypothetical protein BSK49_15240 [Paenibacillus odorifer]|nr:hypothetical protein BK121_26890 [Paenibacillus odorifer]OMD88345.1 hypothetical protein BSK49_15240 [Paenibacillus odorifer]